MTRKEAEKVIGILLQADGGCLFCASKLVHYFIKDFPKYAELGAEKFNDQYDYDLKKLEDW